MAKTMMLGSQEFDIVESDLLLPIHADVYTELRIIGTQVRLALASAIIDGQCKGELRIVARLSLSLETLSNISAAVQTLVNQSEEAKKVAN